MAGMMKKKRLCPVSSVNRTFDSSSALSLDFMSLKKRKKNYVTSLWDVVVVGWHDQEEPAEGEDGVQCEQDV